MAEPPPARDETHGADIHHHGSAQHAMATTGQSYRQQDKHGKKQQAEDDPHQCFVLRPLHGPATAAAIRTADEVGQGRGVYASVVRGWYAQQSPATKSSSSGPSRRHSDVGGGGKSWTGRAHERPSGSLSLG